MRLFELQRDIDVSGASGTGRVAQGVVFDDGTCSMRWTTSTNSTCLYNSLADLERIHGHDGKTRVVMLDLEALAALKLTLHELEGEGPNCSCDDNERCGECEPWHEAVNAARAAIAKAEGKP